MLVTYEYFTSVYLGEGVSAEDFLRLELRAEEAIDNLTRGALGAFSEMSEGVQELVRKAISAQVEYYGLYSTEIGFKAEGEGYTVGKVTVGASQASNAEGSKAFYSPRAISFLERTGLLNRNVGVVC